VHVAGERAGRAVAFLAGVACCAALAGCESNPEPAPLPNQSPAASTPTETESPTPTPPTMPAEAKGTSEKSAKAFVRYYFKSINAAAATGSTSSLTALATPGCESCKTIAGNIEDIYAAGGSIETEGWEPETISAVPLQPKKRPVFDLDVRIHPELVVRKAGASAERSRGGRQAMTMHLRHGPSGWKVTRLDRVA